MQSQTARAFGELAIHQAGKLVQVLRLELDRYEIGRADTNALCFRGASGVSRRHAAFEREGGHWCVRDLESTNGTFVNGTRIASPQRLRTGDRVTIGELNIAFAEAPARSQADHTIVFVEEHPSQSSHSVEATLESVLDTDVEIQGSAHMRALVQAGRELCGHLSLDELFNVIMDLSVETVGADRGILITLEAGEYHVRASKGAGFEISSHVRDLVINERRSLLVRDALTDESLRARMSIVVEHVRGILAVPLQTEKNVLGLIYLDSPVHIREFTKDDLNVLTVLANIAAIRIEQARLAEIEQAEKVRNRELEHAALIQRSMLPGDTERFLHRKDFDLHASMVPAREVGGDLYDYFLLDDDHLAFAIGDVSGKGVPAALFMAVAGAHLRATARNRKDPGEVFTQMNRALLEGNVTGMFVTLFYAVMDTRTGELEYANAGHNLPYIFSSDGNYRKLPAKGGPMIGLLEDQVFSTLTTRIAPGEGILLYTDGVTEAFDKGNEFFGDERLESFLAGHASLQVLPLVLGLHNAVQDFANGMPQADDITILGLRYLG
jgi:serine phosphatase RsbU (regulator of sigma subunit)